MKPWRVGVSSAALAAVVLAFFVVPLPVSRVRQQGLVQVQPTAEAKVHVTVPGILKTLNVRDGQQIDEGFELAVFTNLDAESELAEARTERGIRQAEIAAAQNKLQDTKDSAERNKLVSDLARLRGEYSVYNAKVQNLEKMMEQLVLRAPRGGVVMNAPRVDEVGRQWDTKERNPPFCTIGDPNQLWVLVPVSTADYNLLKADLAESRKKGRELDVDLRVQGLAERTWKGKVVQLPESEAKDVPLALTIKAGGPVPVKPAAQPDQYVPQNQQYLVAVSIDNPGGAICPGTLAQVKIHCRWRTCAWWVWRTISSTFDLGLI